MAYPPAQCSYASPGALATSSPAFHRKVWLTVGTTRRLFEIGLLENFIHYGLDYRRNRSGCHGPEGPVDPWALPYESPEDELPDGPGILPKSLRRGLLEILPRLHQRGFLVFHEEALKTQPRRARTNQPGYPVMNTANLAFWYRQVMRDGDWQLTPMAKHLFTAAKAWLEAQPLCGDTGTREWSSCSPLTPEDAEALGRVEGQRMGIFTEVVHCPLSPKKERNLPAGDRLYKLRIDPSRSSVIYWLKQDRRLREHHIQPLMCALDPIPTCIYGENPPT